MFKRSLQGVHFEQEVDIARQTKIFSVDRLRHGTELDTQWQ